MLLKRLLLALATDDFERVFFSASTPTRAYMARNRARLTLQRLAQLRIPAAVRMMRRFSVADDAYWGIREDHCLGQPRRHNELKRALRGKL